MGFELDEAGRNKLNHNFIASKNCEFIFKKDDINLSLFYDTELEKSCKLNDGHKHKRPDYCIIVNKNNENDKKVLFMDAKYKTYDDKEEDLVSEINTVALMKYYNSYTDKACGAYIIHPNENFQENDNYKIHKYLYGAKKYIKKYKDFYKPCGICGAAVTTPDNDIDLERLLKMFFEYKCSWYDKYCWHCGSKELIKTTGYTAAGNEKYFYLCENCNESWLKTHCQQKGHDIIKHLSSDYDKEYNYHSRSSISIPFYFDCPVCAVEEENNSKNKVQNISDEILI